MIDLEHEALHNGNHPDYIDLRPPLDLLDPESLWTFDSFASFPRFHIISSNPVKDRLCAFRQLFESTRVDLGVVESSNTMQAVLSAATGLEATRTGVTRYTVFNLILTTSPKRVTPPIAFEKAVFDTSLRSSSASQRGVEQTYDEVDQRILEELTGRVYYDIGGFYEQYFKGKSWTKNTRDIYGKSRAQYAESRWSGWPEPSLQGPFFKWFMKFQDTILSGLGRRYYTSANKVLRGSEADRKLDIFLTPADAVLLHGEHDWSNVLVIGEHKQNPDDDGSTKTLVQLAGYAREVFGSQPERRFVPGFTICGSMMRLWVFDRSGLYNSEKFDAHKEPERFIRVIAGGRSGSSASRVIGIGIGVSTSSSGQERKRNERLDRGSRLKRSKYDGSYASGTNVRAQEGELDTIGALSIQETVVDSLADCRNEWQRNNVDCIQEAGVDSFTDYECETYSNRVNYCLVTSPAGRSLREYQSVRELLEVLRDAIRGHRSLLEDGKILHRDISENNIITELPAEGDPKGRLIDLDLAKELDSMPSGARHRTGTMQFMAIEVLEGKGHTYRHDLESFFYVFLWICVRYGYEGTDEATGVLALGGISWGGKANLDLFLFGHKGSGENCTIQ
ncbi:hypothetical protein SS1G_10422 [Sclerotinia sclerotiorum 1980 UF-70]|uniref:Protein kinase domain-containing protein n=1 Tax=Sclerotinia sclerotiorum (strain ATCC 18683 / 1980 / Ss-1) TaxID=665079 RepID=A7EYK6_SCLS1|nr:hypothetical protein SS1G_10422 [Sclerotinia sclerotiorum 1980 UF-70]EDN94548.1 hypothetical protein SS1G_10422 [Sclerotinia sclerotiorum 1980 UF-70]